MNELLNRAIASRVSPSISALVGVGDAAQPIYSFVGGTHSFSKDVLCTPETIYDLASLTKVLATTLITAEAIAIGKLALDERPFARWPHVRVDQLLTHTSGLPAVKQLFSRGITRAQAFAKALNVDLEYTPSTKTVYSDIGFIALGDLIERRLKTRLDELFQDLSQRYYVGSSLFFIHQDARTHKRSSFAPTGFCPIRRRKLRGEVNDLNAFALDQIAPHAGLFGRLDDVFQSTRFLLRAIKSPSNRVEKLIQYFARFSGKRALGFDKADFRGSTGGAFSSQTVGHLGFTGTSLWMDPLASSGQGAYFILLTNRVEASSSAADMLHLRQNFHRIAAQMLK